MIRKRIMPVLACLVLWASCGGDEAPPPEVIRPVRHEPVYATGAARERSFSGVAAAGVESRLSFRVPGRLEEVAVKVGDDVRRGARIARLDSRDFDLQVQEARASLERAQAEARRAASNYDRVRTLYENRNASRTDLDAARAAAESGEAAVRSAEKALQLAQSQRSYAVLEAPESGAIADVRVEAGENVSAGQVVALLTAGSDIEVRVAIPEVLISQIRENDEVVARFDALDGQTFEGRVTEVGVATTGVATTYPVIIRLDDPNDRVRSGMAAEVAFRFGSSNGRERIFAPPFAVGEDREGRFVFVVVPDSAEGYGVTQRRGVVAGDLTEEGLEILEGLGDGDLLVTAGVSKIRDGERVRLTAGGEAR